MSTSRKGGGIQENICPATVLIIHRFCIYSFFYYIYALVFFDFNTFITFYIFLVVGSGGGVMSSKPPSLKSRDFLPFSFFFLLHVSCFYTLRPLQIVLLTLSCGAGRREIRRFLNFEIVSLLVIKSSGLASSAAGYACLVTALCKLYNITGDTSVLARYENFGHLVAFYDFSLRTL